MLKFKKGELDWIGINKDDFPNMAYRDDRRELPPEATSSPARFGSYCRAAPLRGVLRRSTLKDPLVGAKRALRQAIAWALDVHGSSSTCC